MTSKYTPSPVDTSGVEIPAGLSDLTEELAKNAHENWAQQRTRDGWRYGPRRDDIRKEHPGLVPYNQLTESEKEYDRVIVRGTLKAILALGYRIDAPSLQPELDQSAANGKRY